IWPDVVCCVNKPNLGETHLFGEENRVLCSSWLHSAGFFNSTPQRPRFYSQGLDFNINVAAVRCMMRPKDFAPISRRPMLG
ncbi:hypothetical protein IFM89_002807, partial [Coptis chinensis]